MKQKKYRINKDMIAQKIQGNEVIFDSEKSLVYTLNETATFIFNKVLLKKNEEEIVKSIVKEYSVDQPKAIKDISEAIEDMVKKRILIVSGK